MLYMYYSNNNIELTKLTNRRSAHAAQPLRNLQITQKIKTSRVMAYVSAATHYYYNIYLQHIIICYHALMVCSDVSGKVARNFFSCCTKRFFQHLYIIDNVTLWHML